MTRDKTISMKEQIINKSIRLFIDKGYNASTIKNITDAVSITKGAFYWHFKSKNELLETILNLYERTFTDTLIREVRGIEGTFLRKMKYTHKWVTEFAYHNRDFCVCYLTVLVEMAGSGTGIEEKTKKIYLKYLEFLKELTLLGKKEGYIRDNLDINIVANAINAFHNGSLLEWHMNHNKIDGALFARTYGDILLYGMIKSGGQKKDNLVEPILTG
ncbi:MAG TPA: hypothetical protein DDW17_06500 [Deltaproteobacteria bacterium]|nr:hypothetical protein [Deltaproteobacteria bacterium]